VGKIIRRIKALATSEDLNLAKANFIPGTI
jgi:hypothetical protein